MRTDGLAIETHDLAVGYDGRVVVGSLDLQVKPGDLLALMGTNGSGKSTILKTMAGLLPPVSGSIEILGSSPGASPRDVAYLCQNPPSSFTLPLRASDVVAMGRYASLGLLRRPSREDRAMVAAAVQRMGVDAFENSSLRELSGGQQQRTHLAQAISRHGRLLLVDEPTAGLDAHGRQTFASVVEEERQRGCAVVIATHDLEDAEVADTVVLLAPGFVAAGTPREVLTDANLRLYFGATGQHHGPHHGDHDH
jgi:ABC-type Mn2+/Zn2+ transport system ATPase subunit